MELKGIFYFKPTKKQGMLYLHALEVQNDYKYHVNIKLKDQPLLSKKIHV